MKKGQAELVGLVVIVMILIFALLFYIRFSGGDNDDSIQVRTNTRVNNMLNALLLVNVDDRQMKDALIEDCGLDYDASKCSLWRDRVEFYMGEMNESREDYSLEFEGFSADLVNFNNCESGISANPARFRKSGFSYAVKLKLCS